MNSQAMMIKNSDYVTVDSEQYKAFKKKHFFGLRITKSQQAVLDYIYRETSAYTKALFCHNGTLALRTDMTAKACSRTIDLIETAGLARISHTPRGIQILPNSPSFKLNIERAQANAYLARIDAKDKISAKSTKKVKSGVGLKENKTTTTNDQQIEKLLAGRETLLIHPADLSEILGLTICQTHYWLSRAAKLSRIKVYNIFFHVIISKQEIDPSQPFEAVFYKINEHVESKNFCQQPYDNFFLESTKKEIQVYQAIYKLTIEQDSSLLVVQPALTKYLGVSLNIVNQCISNLALPQFPFDVKIGKKGSLITGKQQGSKQKMSIGPYEGTLSPILIILHEELEQLPFSKDSEHMPISQKALDRVEHFLTNIKGDKSFGAISFSDLRIAFGLSRNKFDLALRAVSLRERLILSRTYGYLVISEQKQTKKSCIGPGQLFRLSDKFSEWTILE